jgi:HAMP domain-containing protein
MKKHKKLKLSAVIIVCITLILLGLTFALSYISINSIEFLGKHSMELDEKSTRDNAMLFFLEITRRTAGEYSTYLGAAEDMLDIAASQMKEILTGKVNYSQESNKNLKFKQYSNSDFYVLNGGNNYNCFYIGDIAGLNRAEIKANQILSIKPLLKTLYEKNSIYFRSIWLQTKDKLHFEYPKYYDYKTINISLIKKYFTQIFSEYPEKSDTLNNKSIWSKPYKDISEGMNFDIYKYIYADNGEFLASIGIDLNFEKLIENITNNNLFSDKNPVSSNDIDPTYNKMEGFIFVVDKTGSVILYPNKFSNLLSLPKFEYSKMNSYPEKLSINLNESLNINIKNLATDIEKSDSGIKNVDLKGQNYIIAYKNIYSTGWILCFAVMEKSLMTSVKETKDKMLYTKKNMSVRFIVISLIFLIFFISVTFFLFKYYLLKPLSELREKSKEIGNGNFKISLNESGFAEISDLANNFNIMAKKINDYIIKLSNSIAKREAIEANIKVAANLQLSSLPKPNPVFQDNKNVSLAARLIPSELTSGDFYDYFFIDKNKLFFTVGDISGKSIPAALFMTSTKLLIKKYALMGKRTNEIMKEVNNALVLDNKKYMYSTVFCGILDTNTGEINYCNCGHVKPIITQKGKAEFLHTKENFLVGLNPDFDFESESTHLSKGNLLLIYSDGITEAKNINGEFYSKEKLLKKIQTLKDESPRVIADKLIEEIISFSNNCKQYDDFTVLAIKFN